MIVSAEQRLELKAKIKFKEEDPRRKVNNLSKAVGVSVEWELVNLSLWSTLKSPKTNTRVEIEKTLRMIDKWHQKLDSRISKAGRWYLFSAKKLEK